MNDFLFLQIINWLLQMLRRTERSQRSDKD